MSKIDVNRKIEQLRQTAASSGVGSFAAELRPLLEADFSLWFRILREQKLVNSFREVACIRELRRLLLSPPLCRKISASEIHAIQHHFEVCEFMQEVFGQIDLETASLSCHVADPEHLARAVIRMTEMANYTFQKNAVEDPRSLPQRISMLQVANMERQFRDVLDAGNIILNSRVSRSGTDANYTVDDADLNELVRLAFLYDEMRQIFDLYTYQGAEMRIKRRSLVVTHTQQDAGVAAVIGGERSADHDHVRSTLLANFDLAVRRECASIPFCPTDTFFHFLKKVNDSAAGARARQFGRAFANDLAFEIHGIFDLTTEVRTGVGTFKVDELIQAWAFFATLALLGQCWNEDRAVITTSRAGHSRDQRGNRLEATIRDISIPALSRNWLVRMLGREVGLSHSKATRMIEQFTSRPAAGRIDLFYKPLLLLANDMVLLPTPYIRGSRFERNLFVLIATESSVDQRKKGYLPVHNLQQPFRDAGFKALLNFRVQVNHQELTDIDLVAFKDGLLFLGQCKIVIEPDTVYDTWKAEGKLAEAARQLDTCITRLDDVRATLFERLGLRGQRELEIVAFILTNTRQFTDRVFGGYQVVDIPYLRFVLAGARISVIGVDSERVGFGSGRSFIKGERPTAEELAGLIKRTFHRAQRREYVYRHALRRIGDYKVHIPLMTMRTAGESHVVFTDEEIFDNVETTQPWRRIRSDFIRQNS